MNDEMSSAACVQTHVKTPRDEKKHFFFHFAISKETEPILPLKAGLYKEN